MTAVARNIEAGARWDRGNLEEWRATLSPERRAADEQTLARIFNLAAQVPELKDALDWAQAHGIEFIVDHNVRAGGYYTVGTGVVAIAKRKCLVDSSAASVLVHEIRHAWQDWYGMIPTTGKNFTDYFTRLSLIEADATAHEKLALYQAEHSRIIKFWQKDGGPLNDEKVKYYKKMMHERASGGNLWKDFAHWYDTRSRVYGDIALKFIGQRLGIPGVSPADFGQEYAPPEPKTPGIDITSAAQIRRLGKGFRGGNYFDAAPRDILVRKMLSPAQASNLFRSFAEATAADAARKPLLNEVRKRTIRLGSHKGKAVLL